MSISRPRSSILALSGSVVLCLTAASPPLAEAAAQGRGGQSAARTAGREIVRYAAADSDGAARSLPRPDPGPSSSVDTRQSPARADDNDRQIHARVVTIGNVVEFPFGLSQPVVTCTLLRACIIELQDGETVVNEPIAGDPVRWIIEGAKAGPGGRNALVVVKPKFCEITTNLVVPTDRRIYDLTLDSPPCKTRRGEPYNPQQSYSRHVRFSYPDDSTATGAPVVAGRVASAQGRRLASGDWGLAGDVNHAYRIVQKRRGPFGLFGHKPLDFPWRPAAVYDDGAHLYLALPPEARHQAAPVLYALELDGSRTLLNYTVRQTETGDGLYVADRVVLRAALVLRSGAREQRLVIENRAFGKATQPAAAPEGGR